LLQNEQPTQFTHITQSTRGDIYVYKHERRTIMKTLSRLAVSIFIVFFSFIFFFCATQQHDFVSGDLVFSDRDEYGLPVCHDETLRRSPLKRLSGGEIGAKMSQADRYVDGHVRVSRDGKEMHVDAKVIRINGNLNVGRNLYFEGDLKVEGSMIMGNERDAFEEIMRLEEEIEEMTAIVEELEGHHTLTDANFHAAVEKCLTMNNGRYEKDGACEALHYGGRIGDWDVSRVSNFTRAFIDRAEFNADLSRWNTSSATSFDEMFKNAAAFNGDVSKWKTKSATATKDDMFTNAVAFKRKYLCAKYTDSPEELSSCAEVSTDWVAPSPPPSPPPPP